MASRFEKHWREQIDFLDVHYHANPDLYLRRYNSIQTGEVYKDLGGAVVLKNHLGGCAEAAVLARERGLPVFGSVVMNEIAGGIQLSTLKQQLCYHGDDHDHVGRLLVHLPTNVVHEHTSVLDRTTRNLYSQAFALNPLTICNTSGELSLEVCELFEWAREYPIVISTGHASRREIEMLVDLSVQGPLPVRLMLNQPANPMTGMLAQDLLALGHFSWLFVEQTSLTVLLGYQTEDDFHRVLREVPNLVYSSDLGQTSQMTPQEWIDWSDAHFEAAGLTQSRRDDIRLGAPLRMLAP